MLVIDRFLGKLLTGHEEGEVHVTSIQGSLKMLIGEISKMQIMSLIILQQKGLISSESISI